MHQLGPDYGIQLGLPGGVAMLPTLQTPLLSFFRIGGS